MNIPSDEFNDLASLIRILTDDVERSRDRVDSDLENEFARREHVRNVFAALEGIVFAVRSFAIKFDHQTARDLISNTEKVLSEEKTFEIDRSGNVRYRNSYLNFSSSIRFSFKLFTKAFEIDDPLDINHKEDIHFYKGTEWEALGRAVEIRNRLTHPKSTEHLFVDNMSFLDVLRSWNWLIKVTADAMNSITPKFDQFRDDYLMRLKRDRKLYLEGDNESKILLRIKQKEEVSRLFGVTSED